MLHDVGVDSAITFAMLHPYDEHFALTLLDVHSAVRGVDRERLKVTMIYADLSPKNLADAVKQLVSGPREVENAVEGVRYNR